MTALDLHFLFSANCYENTHINTYALLGSGRDQDLRLFTWKIKGKLGLLSQCSVKGRMNKQAEEDTVS